MRPKIEIELQRQVDLGILVKVDISELAAPVVPVIKPSGEIRLCGDYKVSVNPYLEIKQYPLPHPESRLTVVSREAKKKQHACASSGPRDHYSDGYLHGWQL